MAKLPYHVEYQVFSTIYFEPESVLSGPDLVRLWSGTSVFGKHKGHGSFWHQGTVPNPGNQRSVALGSLGLLQPLLDRGSQSIFGGVSCGQPTGRFVDCDFFFTHEYASRSFGYELLPLFMMGISGQWFERTGTEAVFAFVGVFCAATCRLPCRSRPCS
jgi:hypothetical protein